MVVWEKYDRYALLRAVDEAKFCGVLFDTELPQNAVVARVANKVLRFFIEVESEQEGDVAIERWWNGLLIEPTGETWAAAVSYASAWWTGQWDGWTQTEREQALRVLVSPGELTDATRQMLALEIGNAVTKNRLAETMRDEDALQESATSDSPHSRRQRRIRAASRPAMREDLRFSSDTQSEEFALLRIILEAKFHDEPEDDGLSGSEPLSRIGDQLFACVVARDVERLGDEVAERWQRWRMLTPERREWKVACERAVSAFGREWDTLPLSDWKEPMRNVLLPFEVTDGMLMQLVEDVDQLVATDDWLRTKSHFMLIERELEASGLSAIVQRPLGERDDVVRIVAEREFSDLRACRLVTDAGGSVDSLIDEVRDAQRRGANIEETTFARLLRVAIDAEVRFVIWQGDEHEKPFNADMWSHVRMMLQSNTAYRPVRMCFRFIPCARSAVYWWDRG